jgi:hypothetical protein
MEPRDPTADIEPNFNDEVWDALRSALIEGGKSEEEAVGIIRESWKAQHDKEVEAWNEHLRQRQQDHGPENNPDGPTNGLPREDSPGNEVPDWFNQPTPNFLDILPTKHIVKKLMKEYVELWHFTAQGC